MHFTINIIYLILKGIDTMYTQTHGYIENNIFLLNVARIPIMAEKIQ